MNNLPIYRAKKLDSDDYEIGFLLNNMIVTAYEQEVKRDGIYWKSITTSKIDPTTLAIHFPDTNIKDLFFGIDNGKGASIIEALFIEDNTPFKGVAMHTHYGYVFYDKNDDWVHITKLKDIKVIGIQE